MRNIADALKINMVVNKILKSMQDLSADSVKSVMDSLNCMVGTGLPQLKDEQDLPDEYYGNIADDDYNSLLDSGDFDMIPPADEESNNETTE